MDENAHAWDSSDEASGTEILQAETEAEKLVERVAEADEPIFVLFYEDEIAQLMSDGLLQTEVLSGDLSEDESDL